MNTRYALVVALTAVLIGCNGKEDELQKQLSQVQSERTSLQQTITDRDKTIDEVMQSVNQVYADLEQARMKEGKLKKQSDVEGPTALANVDTKDRMLQEIGDIGANLKSSRQRLAALQSKVKKFNGQIAGLTTMVDNLNKSLQEREQSIAQLEAKVQGLESTVAENTRVISEKDATIDSQTKTINTVFYIVGTKDELKKKGIITDEGGFLWGLLGSTTIMSGNVDQTNFTPLDKTKDQTIHVDGKIEEILPRRNADLFATDESGSQLTITHPDKFWADNYLVIIKD